jgi:hypothetical protein
MTPRHPAAGPRPRHRIPGVGHGFAPTTDPAEGTVSAYTSYGRALQAVPADISGLGVRETTRG